MQKVIAIAVDVNQLISSSDAIFSFKAHEELNRILEQGWEIEDWTFLTDEPIDGKVPMMVILTDDLSIDDDMSLWDDEDYEDETDEEE